MTYDARYDEEVGNDIAQDDHCPDGGDLVRLAVIIAFLVTQCLCP